VRGGVILALFIVSAVLGYTYYELDRDTDRNYDAILRMLQECRRD
jgi:hypothetical protein